MSLSDLRWELYLDMILRRVVNPPCKTNNPGPWFLHCHIDFHLADGFAIVFAEDIPDIAAANPVPCRCPTSRTPSSFARSTFNCYR